jgi:hypothetical protein
LNGEPNVAADLSLLLLETHSDFEKPTLSVENSLKLSSGKELLEDRDLRARARVTSQIPLTQASAMHQPASTSEG